MGRLRDVVTGRPEDKMIEYSGDVRETWVVHVF